MSISNVCVTLFFDEYLLTSPTNFRTATEFSDDWLIRDEIKETRRVEMRIAALCVLLFSASYCDALSGPTSVFATLSDDIALLKEDSSEEGVFTPLASDSSNEEATCNDAKFDQCNVAFAKDVNITKPITSAMEFVKILRRIVHDEGKNGFVRLCKAFNKYKTCLAATYSACVNVEYLKKRGVPPKDAVIYVTITLEFNYECSPTSLRVLLDNWDCIASTEQRYSWHTKKCVRDFEKRLKKRPKNVCSYIQNLVECIVWPYEKKCNKSVAPILCRTAQAALNVTVPQCNVTCKNSDTEHLHDVLVPELTSTENADDAEDEAPVIVGETSNDAQIPYPLVGVISKQMLYDAFRESRASCDDSKFRPAIDHFAQLFGFQKLPDNVAEFIKALSNLITRQKKHGFKRICEAGKEFYRRLGKDQYNLCVTQDNFESLGFTKENAFVYMDIAAQMIVECGDEYDIYLANFDCIVQTPQQKADDFRKCADDFTKNKTQDPTKLCDYLTPLLTCVKTIYADSCNDDVAYAICMTEKARCNHIYPNCKSVSCTSKGVDGPHPIQFLHQVPLRKVKAKVPKYKKSWGRRRMGFNDEDF